MVISRVPRTTTRRGTGPDRGTRDAPLGLLRPVQNIKLPDPDDGMGQADPSKKQDETTRLARRNCHGVMSAAVSATVMPGVIASAKSRDPDSRNHQHAAANSAVVAGKAPSSDPTTRKYRVGRSVQVRGGARKRNAASSSRRDQPAEGKSGCSGGNILVHWECQRWPERRASRRLGSPSRIPRLAHGVKIGPAAHRPIPRPRIPDHTAKASVAAAAQMSKPPAKGRRAPGRAHRQTQPKPPRLLPRPAGPRSAASPKIASQGSLALAGSDGGSSASAVSAADTQGMTGGNPDSGGKRERGGSVNHAGDGRGGPQGKDSRQAIHPTAGGRNHSQLCTCASAGNRQNRR